MENSVGSTIEHIKRQEQNKEAKLKAKREYEATKLALERSFSEGISQVKKYREELLKLVKKTDECRSQLIVQKIRRDALVAQVEVSTAELKVLRAEVVQKKAEIQKVRSMFCELVQNVSDECDVWALLTKPKSAEAVSRTVKKLSENTEKSVINEGRLKCARERRERAIAERERLVGEPDTGEEFIRIKNALRYSVEMTANLRK